MENNVFKATQLDLNHQNIFRTCISKIRNTGISSLYLALLVNAQNKIFKNLHSSSLWTC